MTLNLRSCSRKCDTWCAKGLIDAEKLLVLEKMYEKLLKSSSASLLKKYLKRDIYEKLKFRRSLKGSTLLECINSGFENYNAKIGIYAPEPDAYKIFADLFDPIIEEYHVGFKKTDVHPYLYWGNMNMFGNVDPEGKYIICTRISCSRNLANFSFHPLLEKAEYKEIEKKIVKALNKLPEELSGCYYSLKYMTDKEQQELRGDHLLFQHDKPFLRSAKAYNHWPSGRGVFYNDDLNFGVWINEEDHVKVMSMDDKGNIGEAYRRLAKGLNFLSTKLDFCKCRRLGYVTFSPSNLGTTMEASVHIKVCKLPHYKNIFKGLIEKYKLVIKRVPGEHPKGTCYYKISNRRTLGITEHQTIKELCEGLKDIIKTEQELGVQEQEEDGSA